MSEVYCRPSVTILFINNYNNHQFVIVMTLKILLTSMTCGVVYIRKSEFVRMTEE